MNNDQMGNILLCPLCGHDIPLVSFDLKQYNLLHFRCIILQTERELTLQDYKIFLNNYNYKNQDNKHWINANRSICKDNLTILTNTINYKVNSFELQLICNEHKEKYVAFCINCYKSICSKCNYLHSNHTWDPINCVVMNEKLKEDEEIKTMLREEQQLYEQLNSTKKNNNKCRLFKQINKLFSTHQEINNQLYYLWTLIINTAIILQNYPNYALMSLINKINIKKENTFILNKDILSNCYTELANHLENNYIINLRKTKIKDNSKIDSYDCECHNKRIRSLIQLRDDNNICTSSEDETIKIWELNSMKCVKILKGHDKTVTCLFQLKDKRLISGSFDHSIKFWDLELGESIASIQGEHGSIWCLNQILNEDLVSGSYYHVIQIWDIKTFQCKANMICANSIWEMNQFSNGQLLVCVEKNLIEIWNPMIIQRITTIEGHNERIMNIIELSGSEKFATCSIDNTIKIWHIATFKCFKTISGHSDGIYSIVQINTRLLASCSWDKTLKIWDIATSQCIYTLPLKESGIGLIKLRDGRLASIAGTLLTIWNN